MKTAKIENLLTSNAYPGRGIIIGRSADGKTAGYLTQLLAVSRR